MTINWRFIVSKWWKVIAMGVLIVIGIIIFPQAKCAVAQTCDSPPDLWCGNGQEGYCCLHTGGIEYYKDKCTYRESAAGPYCDCSQSVGKSPITCNDDGTCNVTDWHDFPYDTKIIHGITYFNAKKVVVRREKGDDNKYYCGLDDHYVQATCCSGSSGGGGGGCTPSYEPPTIDDTYTVDPPNPIVWTQEQAPYGLALGMTINDIRAHGGQDTRCGTGRTDITSITLSLDLTSETRNWILGELSQRYINVRIKDTYPKYPERPDPGHPYSYCAWTDGLSGLGSPDAEMDCRFFRPLDPGLYSVNVTACQADGQCTTKALPPVRVWLLENSLSGVWK